MKFHVSAILAKLDVGNRTEAAQREPVLAAYEEAIREGYLWLEFGNSHLLLP